jgi:DNA gyrase subunit A
VPDSSRIARGTPLVNLIEIDNNELVTAVVATTSYADDFMLLATRKGEVKKTPLREFESVRRAGLIAMGLEDGDELVFARLAKDNDEVVLVSSQGKAMRFGIGDLRSASRTSGGVRGMKINDTDDSVIGMEVVEDGAMLLTLSETGLGKRTPFDEYPSHGRGGQGVLTHNVTTRTGRVAAARAVKAEHELIVVSESGIVMRTTVGSISQVGRSAQGVHVMNIGPSDRVAEIAVIDLSKFPETAGELDSNDGDGDADTPVPAPNGPNHRGPSGRGRARRRR